MADRTIKRKPEITEPPTKKTKPKKRRWPWILLGTVILALLAFIVYFAIQLVGVLSPLLEEVAETPEIAVAAPAVVEPEPAPAVTEPPVVETTVPALTTTVPEVTTTVFLPNVDREELGFLKDLDDGTLGSRNQVHLYGIVLSIDEEKIVLPSEDTPRDAYVLYVDLGDHPETGEAVIGKLLLAVSDHPVPVMNVVRYSYPSGGSTSIDAAEGEERLSLVDVGGTYRFFIAMEAFPCEGLPEELQDDATQEICALWNDDTALLLAYNSDLVDALKGGDLPDPDGMGYMGYFDLLRAP